MLIYYIFFLLFRVYLKIIVHCLLKIQRPEVRIQNAEFQTMQVACKFCMLHSVFYIFDVRSIYDQSKTFNFTNFKQSIKKLPDL